MIFSSSIPVRHFLHANLYFYGKPSSIAKFDQLRQKTLNSHGAKQQNCGKFDPLFLLEIIFWVLSENRRKIQADSQLIHVHKT